jgi:hypothetical protein
MGRLRSLTLAALMAALAPGCVHVHTDAAGKVKSVSVGAEPEPDAGVKQASATVPASAVPAATSSLAKFAPKMPSFGTTPAVSLFATWQNRIAKLPDPTSEGKFKPGLVGQLFMFGSGPKMPFAPAEGRVTVELYDASPRPDAGEPVRLGSWTFEKDVLNRLVTTDERFGKCYALFLPWPTYTPAVTRVRMMAKYEPEHGYALHADPVTMTIDTMSGPDGPVLHRTNTTGPLPAPGPLPPPSAQPFQPSPLPVGPPAAADLPPGLPPLTITVPAR